MKREDVQKIIKKWFTHDTLYIKCIDEIMALDEPPTAPMRHPTQEGIEAAKKLIEENNELEKSMGWEREFEKEFDLIFKGCGVGYGSMHVGLKSFISQVEHSAYQRGQESILKNVGSLRQWLNETPIPKMLISDEEIIHWLIL